MDVNAMIDALEAAGYEPYSYSGRFMYGRRCVAVDIASTNNILEVGQALGSAGIDASIYGEARTDSMGLGQVIYWPQAEWPAGRHPTEKWECEHCGEKNREADSRCAECHRPRPEEDPD